MYLVARLKGEALQDASGTETTSTTAPQASDQQPVVQEPRPGAALTASSQAIGHPIIKLLLEDGAELPPGAVWMAVPAAALPCRELLLSHKFRGATHCLVIKSRARESLAAERPSSAPVVAAGEEERPR